MRTNAKEKLHISSYLPKAYYQAKSELTLLLCVIFAYTFQVSGLVQIEIFGAGLELLFVNKGLHYY